MLDFSALGLTGTSQIDTAYLCVTDLGFWSDDTQPALGPTGSMTVNVAVNGLDGRVICLEAAGFDHPRLEAAAPFDLVFANILMGPLIDLAPAMAAHVAPGGRVILSGLLVTQAEAVTAAYAAQGFELETREDLGEWSALTLMKRR